jgi:hypothetical protein
MMRPAIIRSLLSSLAALGLLAGALALHPASARAQAGGVIRDEPTAYSPVDGPAPAEESSGFMGFLQAVCWYLPNRIADLSDVPRFYVTAGDGMGASLRATKYLNASWFEDSAFCLGWSGMRQPPFFSENVREQYLGVFAAQAGELDRDPSEIGLSAHIIVIGANIALSLSESVDFLAGIVGVDLRGDDHGPFFSDKTEKPGDPEFEAFRTYIPENESDPGPAATLEREGAPEVMPDANE